MTKSARRVEVGLGKTIETGLVLRYLILSQKVKRVLVLSPASVQPQWHEELREKFNLHFWSYSEGKLQDPYKESIPLDDNPWNTKDLILASSHLIRRQERMQELLTAKHWDLVVLDVGVGVAAQRVAFPKGSSSCKEKKSSKPQRYPKPFIRVNGKVARAY